MAREDSKPRVGDAIDLHGRNFAPERCVQLSRLQAIADLHTEALDARAIECSGRRQSAQLASVIESPDSRGNRGSILGRGFNIYATKTGGCLRDCEESGPINKLTAGRAEAYACRCGNGGQV